MSPTTWGWLVLVFPIAGTIVCALGFKALPGRSAGFVGSAAILASFVCGIGALVSLEHRPPHARQVVSNLFDYIHTSGVVAKMGILIDPLSVFMVVVVSGVSFLIHVFSVGYMDSDRGYVRFFCYLNYFVFSMLLLVEASNLVLLIVGWAFVGAASYLLISFWYRRSTATAAGIKAFVMNVIGDVGLVIAAFLLWRGTHALDYAGIFAHVDHFRVNQGQVVAACLLLLVGAFAKSAQIPLHTWLPDAMEGPTPVSALIHAATMVTAGVYLIARMHPVFLRAPAAADVGAIIGTLTLVFAALVALAQTDLKRIIAYSTMSQIGYMILGVSIFAWGEGLFHLMTHAFFKALLFMAAASVISVVGGEQSIDRMGGMRRAVPFTFVCFAVGAFSLAGFPPFSGLFSKDEIIGFAFHRGSLYTVLGVLAYVGSLLTAFYAFRMVFRVFFGETVPEARSLEQGEQVHVEPFNPQTGEREDTDVGFPGPEHHIAEGNLPMRLGMAPLAALALAAGALDLPGVDDVVGRFLEPSLAGSRFATSVPATGTEWLGVVAGALIAAVGIGTAYFVYVVRPGTTLELIERFPRVHAVLEHKFYFDELYDALFVRPGETFGRFGRTVVESDLIQGVFVGGAAGVVRAGSSLARSLQSGYLRAYAGLLVAGLAALLLYFLISSS